MSSSCGASGRFGVVGASGVWGRAVVVAVAGVLLSACAGSGTTARQAGARPSPPVHALGAPVAGTTTLPTPPQTNPPTPPQTDPQTDPRGSLPAEPPAQPPPSLTPARVDAAVARLDGVVRDTLARTGVPGMSVAVVYRDRVAYLKGFGVRRAGSPGAVGPDTLFQLASLSKPLASTVVAAVAGQRGVAWDDPVVEHDPGFALADPWVTRHVTLADLFAHRSGLPDHAGDLLEDLGYRRGYILRHLRDEPLAPFRATYAYTNFGFTAAALAVARARGVTWAELSARTLYEPLGMTATTSRFAAYRRAPDRAVTHVRVGGRWEAGPVRDPQAQSPAGGAASTARDLAAWMRLQLGGGVFDGRRVVGRAELARTHLPHIVSSPPRAPYGRAGFYGLGWNVDYDELGRLRLGHSGAFELGAATAVTLLPSEGLGIVALTNGQPVGAPETVTATFLDLAQHGRPTVDWPAFFGKVFAGMEERARAGTDYARPPVDAAPARRPAAYTGTYANGYHGPLTVTREGGGLVMRLGPHGVRRFPLRHHAGDTFAFETRGENASGLSGVRFAAGTGGAITRVTVESLDRTGLGTFTRR
ncbi:serine hydrolase [Nonomuraea indica]|uniref:serine hydrolase n=1 Tax=Nonomuraea indica TaxID=1581193 RepID=UPI001FE691CE|nr:serine hydrolase [Nonomuraea indica]